ncbi:MAG: cob(I)yrinic acid a,c-diamide adenosyltransferase [Chloroflexota bacterium]|jgi:cob(I)alamin adenosyltransferase
MTFIYTGKGDDGYSGLLGEGRVPKYHPRLEALGALDEANAALGMARAFCNIPRTCTFIISVQRDLYYLMAEVAATPENASKFRSIQSQNIEILEQEINHIHASINIPSEFILPGESISGSMFAMARTIIRRAERHIAGLLHSGEIENAQILRYLNRLSSLCFLLEILEYQTNGNSKVTLAKDII